MHSKFGQMLFEARSGKGLTVRKLGEKMGKSPSYLSEIENGLKLPPEDQGFLQRLAAVLGLDFNEFSLAARISRIQFKLPESMARVFDGEVGMALYRATEDIDEDELEALQKKLLETLQKREPS